LSAQSSQAIHFLIWGASIGTSASLYLIYRTKDIIGIAYSQIQIRNRITRGGKHAKKRTKKHKKYNKTSRRRKNKKHSYKRR
jgi:hypothetical protein